MRDSTEWMASRLPPHSTSKIDENDMSAVQGDGGGGVVSHYKPSRYKTFIEGNNEDSSMSKTEQNFMNLFDKSTSQIDMA